MATEESLKILQMIEQGQISAEEGVRLLTAAQPAAETQSAAEPPAATEPVAAAPIPPEPTIVPVPFPDPAPAPAQSKGSGWFRVRVTDMKTNKPKVTVNLPMGLMSAGLKIGAHFAPELEGMNLTEVFQELRNTQPGKIVDVMDEEDGEHVEIFVE